MFNFWINWAGNWMQSLTTLDWTNLLDYLDSLWNILLPSHTGLEFAWDIIWYSTLSFVATIGIFFYWLFIHICYPAAVAFVIGFMYSWIVIPFLYFAYITCIYFALPALIVQGIHYLNGNGFFRKALFVSGWIAYGSLLVYSPLPFVALTPLWYFFLSVIIYSFLSWSNYPQKIV
jgi:hypothetical protein